MCCNCKQAKLKLIGAIVTVLYTGICCIIGLVCHKCYYCRPMLTAVKGACMLGHRTEAVLERYMQHIATLRTTPLQISEGNKISYNHHLRNFLLLKASHALNKTHKYCHGNELSINTRFTYTVFALYNNLPIQFNSSAATASCLQIAGWKFDSRSTAWSACLQILEQSFNVTID